MAAEHSGLPNRGGAKPAIADRSRRAQADPARGGQHPTHHDADSMRKQGLRFRSSGVGSASQSHLQPHLWTNSGFSRTSNSASLLITRRSMDFSKAATQIDDCAVPRLGNTPSRVDPVSVDTSNPVQSVAESFGKHGDLHSERQENMESEPPEEETPA